LPSGSPAAIPDGAQGAIVVWSGSRGADFDIYAARVTHGGGLPWRQDVPVCKALGDQFVMRVIPAPRGEAIAAWLDSRRAPAGDLYAQRISHGGRTAWMPDGVPICTAPGSRGIVVMAGDGSDGAYLAWGDSRPEGELFAMHLTGEGEPAPGWPADGALVCEWQPTYASHNPGVSALDITPLCHGRAMVAWQDWRKAPIYMDTEHSLAMLLTPDGPAALPPVVTGVDPPAQIPARPEPSVRPEFALRGVQPSPAVGACQVVFSLPDASPAQLEMMDVAGRKALTLEVGSLGPGWHAVHLAAAQAMPAGVYLLRLAQGGRSLTARAVFIR
jgi:hypothetical protein